MSTAARFSRLTRLDAGRIDTRTLLIISKAQLGATR